MRSIDGMCGLVACVVLAGGWTACSSTVVSQAPKEEEQTAGAKLLMRRATSCEDLEEALKADARARLQLAMLQQDGSGTRDPWDGAGGASAADAGAANVGGSGGSTAGGAGSSGAAGAGTGHSGTPNFTGTNTQVSDIDEADFVKTDGSRIFQLRENLLHIAKAWPAPELSPQSSIEIEGQPLEMFLVGDAGSVDEKLVVFSQVDGTGIYAQAGLEPPSDSISDPGVPGSGGASSFDNPGRPSGAVLLTKITVISVAGPSPSVLHELYHDGSYVSSRRRDLSIRTVLRVPGNMPALRTEATAADRRKAEMMVISRLLEAGKDISDIRSDELDEMVREALGEVLVKENEAIIEAISYTNWLPHVFTKPGGQLVTDSVPCENFYIPKPGTSQIGITHVAALDLADLSSPGTGTAILGVAATMYQNASAMVLASSAFNGDYEAPSWQTYVHAFGVQGQPLPAYHGSGVVHGRILGQFALDEKNGFVRIVTTTGEQWSATGTSNHLFVLEADEGELKVIGDAGEFGKNEEVFAARFVGDTAYVVTFRQTDPLFAIDVSNPRAPKILGELHIPGFSEYMHPLGENHLLTVGRDADPSTGWSQNLALQIFDVRNRTRPQLAHKHVFDNYGTSTAEFDHKAFTYFDDRQLLAIPFAAEEYDQVSFGVRWATSMRLFHVSPQGGISPLGAMSGDPLLSYAELDQANYTCYPDYHGSGFGSSFQRGIFMDDVLYGVARDGVVAANVGQLAQPLGVLRLFDPAVVPDNCFQGGHTGGYGGGIGGTGGAAGEGGFDGGWGGGTGAAGGADGGADGGGVDGGSGGGTGGIGGIGSADGGVGTGGFGGT